MLIFNVCVVNTYTIAGIVLGVVNQLDTILLLKKFIDLVKETEEMEP